MNAFLFTDLSPQRILDAIESIGVYPSSGLLALNSYENRVYQFQADDGLRYVVKFYRPQRWSEAQLREEHAFARLLSEAEVPVVAPLTRDGESLFHYQGLWFALFPSVGGRAFEVDQLEQLERVGQYLGRIHQLSQGVQFTHRPSMNTDDMLDKPLMLLKNWVPQSLHEAFFTIAEQVSQVAKQQYQPKQLLRLHGDCHPSNILWRDGPLLVDLDDARNGPPIQDLWMLLSGDHSEQRIQLDTLLDAYYEFADFDLTQLQYIEALRSMRMIHYMGWLALRFDDPAFTQAFPWFNSQSYWEQQILALKEQLSAMQGSPLTLHGGW